MTRLGGCSWGDEAYVGFDVAMELCFVVGIAVDVEAVREEHPGIDGKIGEGYLFVALIARGEAHLELDAETIVKFICDTYHRII